tara:strand:+ start:3038 stop:3790 length:753 start_codon:yes stop_codon:yes gene_type:complete
MIINEEILRKIIVDHLIKEQVRSGGSIVPGSGDGVSSGSSDESEDVNIDAVTSANGKFYLGNASTGLSEDRFKRLMSEMESYVNSNYKDLGLNIESNGITRDLEKAADNEGNAARISGSKHGAGLAIDVKYHTNKYGKYTNYKENNNQLAKDKKFIKILHDFSKLGSQSDLRWGGFWGGSNPKRGKVIGHGITELHHWEISDKELPKYFEKFPKVKKAIEDLGMTSKDMIKKNNRAKLYKALVSSAKKSS